MTIGMAKMIITEVMSEAHTKSGILRSDIPGARILRMTVVMSAATMSPVASLKVITMFQKSGRLPIPYCGPASGTYSNQPASTPVLQTNAPSNSSPPMTYSQYAHAVIRGKAVLRVPIISGTR